MPNKKEYEVQLIIAERPTQKKNRQGKQYLVKFTHYPFSDCWWNHKESLKNCPKIFTLWTILSTKEKKRRSNFLINWDYLTDKQKNDIGKQYMNQFIYSTPPLTPLLQWKKKKYL